MLSVVASGDSILAPARIGDPAEPPLENPLTPQRPAVRVIDKEFK